MTFPSPSPWKNSTPEREQPLELTPRIHLQIHYELTLAKRRGLVRVIEDPAEQLRREIAEAKASGLIRFAPEPTACPQPHAVDCTADSEPTARDGSRGHSEAEANPLVGHL